jgi:hypothetical protein
VGVRAAQVPDPSVQSYFLSLFGRPARITACACERTGDVTMPQLLHLQNGQDVLQKIRAPGGRLAQLLKEHQGDAGVVRELFLATLCRQPTPAEEQAVLGELSAGGSRDEVLRDLFWALLNAKEFAFNH